VRRATRSTLACGACFVIEFSGQILEIELRLGLIVHNGLCCIRVARRRRRTASHDEGATGCFRMADTDPRDQIELLEGRIEDLAETIERCRKLILVSKVAMAAGAVLLAAVTLGAFGSNPLALILAITGLLGGVVVLGSNTTTAEAALADLKAAEARRAELIGMIELHVVGGRLGLH
jgi:hypothetical protein